MRAVILAAGRGRRLEGAEAGPKCLLDIGGRTLLARILAGLAAAGISEAVMVTGFEADRLEDAARAIPAEDRPPLRFVRNPDYRLGSIVSLWCARSALAGDDDALLLDADVLAPDALLARLARSPHASACLLDRSRVIEGEEMVLRCRDGRVLSIARGARPAAGEVAGESVGWFKLGRTGQPALLEEVARYVEERGERERDYEDAIDRFFGRAVVGYEDVTGAPWIEIDFPDDVRRARAEVLPAIEAGGSDAAAAG